MINISSRIKPLLAINNGFQVISANGEITGKMLDLSELTQGENNVRVLTLMTAYTSGTLQSLRFEMHKQLDGLGEKVDIDLTSNTDVLTTESIHVLKSNPDSSDNALVQTQLSAVNEVKSSEFHLTKSVYDYPYGRFIWNGSDTADFSFVAIAELIPSKLFVKL